MDCYKNSAVRDLRQAAGFTEPCWCILDCILSKLVLHPEVTLKGFV